MRVEPTRIPGLMTIEPDAFEDERGFFMESWNLARYAENGIPVEVVQDNISFSKRGVLRGLHFQNSDPQGKLVSVLQGSVYDVAVDIRRGSPTFGQWIGIELSAENRRQSYLPPGMAHGFCVTSEVALLSYKCTSFYRIAADRSIAWNDPALGIDWPLDAPLLSPKDKAAPRLESFGDAELPTFHAEDAPESHT